MGIEVVGKTTCGTYCVVSGEPVFKLFDTSGLPLDIVLMELRDKGYMADWDSFYRSAKKHGWKHKTILSRLSEALPCYTHVSDFTETVISRLNTYEDQ